VHTEDTRGHKPGFSDSASVKVLHILLAVKSEAVKSENQFQDLRLLMEETLNVYS
jgi:hypothetical protein